MTCLSDANLILMRSGELAEGKPFVQTGELFDCEEAFAHSLANEQLFAQSMREALVWHLKNCPDFAAFMRESGLAENIDQVEPEEIPPLLVTIFKEFRLISVPDDKVKIELTSSGTGGRKSAIVLDNRSYKRIQKIVFNIFSSLGLVDLKSKVNYLCFTYDPKKAGSVGTAFSDKMLTGLTGRRSVFYAIRWNDEENDFTFDLDATVKKIVEFARRPEPVRILGFPAYLWQVCNRLAEKGIKLDFGADSYIITGGGWKMHKDQEVGKDDFKERVEDMLGIPGENIRDLFGMVEHGIPYVDCEKGRLHVPVYARARVVDPETLADLGKNQPGLLHLMTPYLSSYPSISLLTTDVAVIEDGCACGRSGDTFRIVGRAGLAKHKGCAITALELLK
jgi:phenylacetate-coenzyme A ligase PaaK-like adenylate-forming protein